MYRFSIVFFLVFLFSPLASQDLELLTEIYYHRSQNDSQFHDLVNREILLLSPDRRGRTREPAVKLKFLQGLWELDVERMVAADRYLQQADREIDLWIAEDPTSDAYRYRVEVRTMLMLTQGLFYTLTNALSLQEFADKALQLDKDNPRAQMIQGIKMLYAPFFLGGNPDLGRQLLAQLLSNPKLDRQGRFVVHFETANSYYREGRKSQAFFELQKARNYYPRSFIVQKMESNWKKG